MSAGRIVPRAVVLESDDWGFCAWVPDEPAYRALANTPAFRTPAGRVYGRSTLESAADVTKLADVLLSVHGGDGLPPVLQANTVMAAPDFGRVVAPYPPGPLPLVAHPDKPNRWRRPGLWQAVERAVAAGVWWPELHGLHHVPEHAWLGALRRGDADATQALMYQVTVCEAVEASGEYARSEPGETRMRNLAHAVELFQSGFGRAPLSLCPPDYRWDEALEHEAERLGIAILQGKAEQMRPLLRVRRKLLPAKWPHVRGNRFYTPPRIAFEPRGEKDGPLGPTATYARVIEEWEKGRPAVISTHRVNYAHLEEAWSAQGRAALADLLNRLVADRAVFLTDAELRDLTFRGVSVRQVPGGAAIERRLTASGMIELSAV
jgi:hypothetical protein